MNFRRQQVNQLLTLAHELSAEVSRAEACDQAVWRGVKQIESDLEMWRNRAETAERELEVLRSERQRQE